MALGGLTQTQVIKNRSGIPILSSLPLIGRLFSQTETREDKQDLLETFDLKRRLDKVLEHLSERYGWEGLGERIPIRCFTHDPSVMSSLKFLRKTPWARAKVESLYLHSAAHPRKRAASPPDGPSQPA